MTAQLVVMSSPLDYVDAQVFDIPAGYSIESSLVGQLHKEDYRPGEDQPITLALNGQIIPADKWSHMMVNRGDQLIVCPRVQDPVTILSLIVTIASIYYASNIPTLDNNEYQPESSPSYEADPQGNRARLSQPIAEHFGRFRVWPSYASHPIHEAEANDEYGYYLLSIGEGSYDLASLQIGDTPIENFEDVQWEKYEPGQRVTLVPTASYSAAEVSGQGLTLFAPNENDYTGVSGPFPANQSETLSTALLFDFVLPRGLNYVNQQGGLSARTVDVRVDYRQIDDNGNPLPDAAWQTVNYSYRNATTDVLRFTERVLVTPGRYQVQAQRVNNSSDDHRENDELRWSGLRSYLDNDDTFDETVLALRIKISAQLSAQSERKINGIFTRRLPVYDLDAQAWLPAQPTRNPIWAFCYTLKRCGYTDANFRDLPALAATAAFCDQRGDYFDGRFESTTNLWAALKRILRVCRALPVNYGDRFGVVRDGPEQRGEYQFIGRNTLKNSFHLSYETVDEWDDDSVIVEYTNPNTWKKEEIYCVLPGTSARNPERLGLLDTTDVLQAQREGMFAVARKTYRNRSVNLSTPLDGRVPYLYDRLLISSTLPRWGSGGEVLAVDGQVLRLSEPVVFAENSQHFIWLRASNGSNSQSYQCGRVFDTANQLIDDQVLVIDELPSWIYTGYRQEKTYFAFAAGEDRPRRMLLTQASPSSGEAVSLRAVYDDDRVHQFDALVNEGSIEPHTPASINNALDLTIRGVYLVHGGTVSAPKLSISWTPVADAQQYFVAIRYAEDSPWQRVYEGVYSRTVLSVAAGAVYVRIAAMAEVVGPWYETGVINTGSEFAVPATPSGLQVSTPFVGKTLSLQWQADVAAVRWRVEFLQGDTVRYVESVDMPSITLHSDVALLSGLGRSINCRVYAVNANDLESAPAQLSVMNPQVGLLSGVLSILNVNALYVEYSLPADEDFAGVRVYIGPPGFDPLTANVYEQTDPTKTYINIPLPDNQLYAVRVAGFDVWGRDNLVLSPEILDVAAGLRSSDLHSTLSARIDLIDTPGVGLVDRLSAEVQNSENARANIQQQLDTLAASYTVPIYYQSTPPVGDIDEYSRWFDTDNGNRPYIYVAGQWVETTDQRIIDNTAAIQNEAVARADQYSAIAATQQTLQTTVQGHTGSIQQSNQAIAAIENDVVNIKLESYVKLDNNGYVVGFGQFNNGPNASGFIVRADTFGISHPSLPDVYPFVFDSTAGQLFVSSAFIPTLDVGKITGDIASFIQANIATVQIGSGNVSGVLQSDNFNASAQSGLSLNFSSGQVYAYDLTARGNITANHLDAATGSFSGALTAQAVNAVDTVNIRGNAIFLTTFFENSGSWVLWSGSNRRDITLTLAQYTVDYSQVVQGQRFLLGNHSYAITARFYGSHTGGGGGSSNIRTYTAQGSAIFRVYRDNQLLYSASTIAAASSTGNIYSMSRDLRFVVNPKAAIDMPPVGNASYRVEVSLSATLGWFFRVSHDYDLFVSLGGKR
ncbi:MAG: hypothetical protein KTR20_12880 [Cellvibrionaceae bacterium]|nr:hypothetical protein [Cellvibrionaceae bacterium]